ncbi:hypothetical protein GCM10027615_63030 [Plantactinospora veratri]
MKALCWEGVGKLRVREVPDPTIQGPGDVIVRVRASSVCGSDLHLINGYLPAMREGDILGHEFMGEVVEVGPEVGKLKVGDRVVVGSVLACGGCWYCRTGQYSLCDNSNPQPNLTETLWGHAPAGIIGYSHAAGGFAGSHAEYVRVPFADVGAFPVPEGSPTTPWCSPPTPCRPAGWPPTSATSVAVRWSRSGVPAAWVRWPPAPPNCSVPSG